jgi:hypothetical protein
MAESLYFIYEHNALLSGRVATTINQAIKYGRSAYGL